MADNSNNPNNVYNNQDGLHTDFEMLTISPRAFRNRRQKKCCNAITNDTICYSNTLFFTVLIMQFLIIYIVFAVYSADLNILIKDPIFKYSLIIIHFVVLFLSILILH